jgi:ribosomal protein S18 acetylase RimI-like enzyme
MMMHLMAHVLDNAVWHALTGPRRAFGERRGRAARFDPDVAPFAAVEDPADPAAWSDLAALVGPGRRAVFLAPPVEPPSGWTVTWHRPCHQLVATGVDTEGPQAELLVLGPDDVPEMLELIELTQPGPFAPRTLELGGYVGVRNDDGHLVAMAGERLATEGFVEVSAVCTRPELRGTGLASALVRAVVAGIRARGDEAFLHVADNNLNALRLYLALGFTERIMADAVILEAPA